MIHPDVSQYPEMPAGTTVSLGSTAPVFACAADAPGSGGAPPAGGRATIVLVEDDDLVRQVVSDSLSEAGEHVAAFADAEAAMCAIGLLGADALVITDINLGGGMNGIRFASLALAQCPWLGIIYITGRYWQLSNHPLGAREKALQKPFRLEELRAVIASLRHAH